MMELDTLVTVYLHGIISRPAPFSPSPHLAIALSRRIRNGFWGRRGPWAKPRPTLKPHGDRRRTALGREHGLL